MVNEFKGRNMPDTKKWICYYNRSNKIRCEQDQYIASVSVVYALINMEAKTYLTPAIVR